MLKGLIITICIFLILPLYSYSQDLVYDYLLELGKKALENDDYQTAIHYFKLAHSIYPYKEEPLHLIKSVITPVEKSPLPKEEKNTELQLKKIVFTSKQTDKRGKMISKLLDKFEKKILQEKRIKKLAKKITSEKKKIPTPKIVKITKKEKVRVLRLTDELYRTQPKTLVEIEVNKSLILEGKSIVKYLVERVEKIDVSRIDNDRVMVTAKSIGSTFFHLWEENRRWTFNVKIIPPQILVTKKEKLLVIEEEPFKFKYIVDWHTYHKGKEVSKLERQTLSFSEWLGFLGPTPYGDMDGSLRVAKYGKSQKLTNYTVGLNDGKIWNFEEFNLRAFDFYKNFSKLSFPGELLKGGLLEANAFNRKLNYVVLWGREKEGFYGYLTPGVVTKRKSYIEGIRLSLFPYEGKRHSFNYLKGYGGDRPDELKDEVYSLESEWGFEDKNFNWELAFDGYSFAGVVETKFDLKNLNLNLNFRNIEKDFVTIIGRPSDRGEIGLDIGTNWRPNENLTIDSSLDVYRARYLYNEGKPKRLNFDWDMNIFSRLNNKSNIVTSLFYVNEPGLSFPRRYLNIRSVYSTSLDIFNKSLTSSLGIGFARSRNPLSPYSDYDTYRTFTSLRYSLNKNLFWYASYEYNWLEEKLPKERANPSVLEVGIDYQKDISPALNTDLRISYRDEKEASSAHSFLSGEDSVEGSLKISVTPVKDTEFFVEGRLRNVWTQISGEEDYAEADIRWGLRSSWDTVFSWSPRGRVSGVVFKDVNGNGKWESDEPTLEGVKVKVGRKELITDKNGYFSTIVRAKKVMVMLAEDTLPEGYVFTTPSSLEVEISHGKKKNVDFGASIFSTIYGVVFYDVNSNKRFDLEDEPLPHVRVFLEDKPTFTNLEGSYYFTHLKEGTYILKLDINTIPLEYIPTVPLKKEVKLPEGINYIYLFPLQKKK